MRLLPVALVVALTGVSAFATDPVDPKSLVREALIAKPYLRAGWIRVRSERNVITLVGRVPDELRRAAVLLTVRNMECVVAVKDELEIDLTLEPPRSNPAAAVRQRLANARKIIADDEALSVFTTLHVSRTGHGLLVTGEVSTLAERLRISKLLRFGPDVKLEVRVAIRPDATRRSPATPPDAATRRWLGDVTAAIASESLLKGLVVATASEDGDALVLRGSATSRAAHDVAFEIAHAKLLERQRALARIRARSGELTRMLGGDPGHLDGAVPSRLESRVVVVGD